MTFTRIKACYLVLAFTYAYLIAFRNGTFNSNPSKYGLPVGIFLMSLIVAQIFLIKYENRFTLCLLPCGFLAVALTVQKSQISTMFAIMGFNLALAFRDYQLLALINRFSVFVGYFYSGINKILSGPFRRGEILDPYLHDRVNFIFSFDYLPTFIHFFVPIYEISLAFLVLIGLKQSLVGIILLHVGIIFLIPNNLFHSVELGIFGALMLLGALSRYRGST